MKQRLNRSILSVLVCLMCLLTENSLAVTGTVRWYNADKGFGFITPDTGGADVFVDFSEVKNNQQTLKPGQSVDFDYRTSAINVKPR